MNNSPPTHHLKPNAKIGIMSPSSYVERNDVETSKATLESQGFQIEIHPQTYARHNQSAGTTAEKIEALHALYLNPTIDAIWAAGGGNRALYLLDHLDYEFIKKNPKPLIGFSDVTALLNPILAHTNQIGWHAQSFKHMHDFQGHEQTLQTLTSQTSIMPLTQCEIVSAGKAQGSLIGGCLSLFHYLPGTNDCPNLNGAILFLEDTGDEMSRFDRMFAHMKRMGVFEQISGLILGEFHNIGDNPARPFGFAFKDIIEECLNGRNIPVVLNAPFGHAKNLFPLPVGAQAVLDTTTKTLTF